MKVALCFIISYKHILQKEEYWIKWIKSNEDLFNIYFHYKNKKQIKSKWILDHCIPECYIQTTSYFHVVAAYMSLLNYAYKNDSKNQWFCMLTESCVPIISPKKFKKIFFENYDKSIMKINRANWNINFHRRANLNLLDKKFHLSNDPWFTLSRYHVRICMEFITEHNGLYKLINSGGLANESIFAIIFTEYEQVNKDALINSSSTIADWYRMANPTSPHLFDECNEQDEIIIKDELKNNPYALFLRKVNYKFPDDKLIQLSSWNIELENNDKSKNIFNYSEKKWNVLTFNFFCRCMYIIVLLEIITNFNFSYFIITKLNELF